MKKYFNPVKEKLPDESTATLLAGIRRIREQATNITPPGALQEREQGQMNSAPYTGE